MERLQLQRPLREAGSPAAKAGLKGWTPTCMLGSIIRDRVFLIDWSAMKILAGLALVLLVMRWLFVEWQYHLLLDVMPPRLEHPLRWSTQTKPGENSSQSANP